MNSSSQGLSRRVRSALDFLLARPLAPVSPSPAVGEREEAAPPLDPGITVNDLAAAHARAYDRKSAAMRQASEEAKSPGPEGWARVALHPSGGYAVEAWRAPEDGLPCWPTRLPYFGFSQATEQNLRRIELDGIDAQSYGWLAHAQYLRLGHVFETRSAAAAFARDLAADRAARAAAEHQQSSAEPSPGSTVR